MCGAALHSRAPRSTARANALRETGPHNTYKRRTKTHQEPLCREYPLAQTWQVLAVAQVAQLETALEQAVHVPVPELTWGTQEGPAGKVAG